MRIFFNIWNIDPYMCGRLFSIKSSFLDIRVFGFIYFCFKVCHNFIMGFHEENTVLRVESHEFFPLCVSLTSCVLLETPLKLFRSQFSHWSNEKVVISISLVFLRLKILLTCKFC